jgi:hypothetical protein
MYKCPKCLSKSMRAVMPTVLEGGPPYWGCWVCGYALEAGVMPADQQRESHEPVYELTRFSRTHYRKVTSHDKG